MSSLTGNTISSTYQSLLKVATNNTASANFNNITDGAGNATALYLSTGAVKISGSFQMTGSQFTLGDATTEHTTITSANVLVADHVAEVGAYLDLHGLELYSGSNFIDITVNGQVFGDNGSGSLIAVSNTSSQAVPVVGFQNHDNFTDGTVSILTPLQATSGFQSTGSIHINGTGSVNLSGSLQMNGSMTFAAGTSAFVFPSQPAPIPTVGSTYFSGSALYIYDGTSYLSVALS